MPLGPYFSLLVVSFSAHAIIRYRLMDIRVVFRKGVVYVCAIAVGATVFIVFVELLKRVTGYDKDSIPSLKQSWLPSSLRFRFSPSKLGSSAPSIVTCIEKHTITSEPFAMLAAA